MPEAKSSPADLASKYFAKPGRRKNVIVGKGLWIPPPVTVETTDLGDGVHRLTIRGAKGTTATIEFTRTLLSQYRPEITLLDDRASPVPRSRKLVPLQPARRKLLTTIEPGGKLDLESFYEKTKTSDGKIQKNARRRWGELRTEYGFDVRYDEENFFRGSSKEPINEPKPRPNMGKLKGTFWTQVYDRHEGKCAKCGCHIQRDEGLEGDPGLLDHRRPVLADGADEEENLQLFCDRCNNLKATVCRKCPRRFECETCTWAHPEKFHDAVVLRFSPQEAEDLTNLAKTDGLDPREYADRLFRSAFKATRQKGK